MDVDDDRGTIVMNNISVSCLQEARKAAKSRPRGRSHEEQVIETDNCAMSLHKVCATKATQSRQEYGRPFIQSYCERVDGRTRIVRLDAHGKHSRI